MPPSTLLWLPPRGRLQLPLLLLLLLPLLLLPPLQLPLNQHNQPHPVKAPLPGTINAINVKVGDKVNVGDVVVVLEAMKMQNNIEAENAGTVTAILVNPGDSVMEGAVMLTIG